LNLQYEGKYDMEMDRVDGMFSVNLQLDLT